MAERNIETLWLHLRWLGVIDSAGSLTAAAQRLGVSKAAVSQRLRELEQAAGVGLVARSTRSLRLTEAGQQLVDATRGPFEHIERGFAGVADRAAAPSGLVRVTAPVALGRQQIVPRLPAFLRAHPEVRIELELSDRLSALAQEGFDLALRHTNAAPETHVAWLLCRTDALLVATRAYLRRRGTPQRPEDLAGHDCLRYLRPGEKPVWSFEAAGRDGAAGRVSVPVAGPFAANNSEALREAALGGLGIALLPDFSAGADLAAGRLQHVLPRWRPVGYFGEGLYAIRPYSPYVPRAVRVLVDHLRAELGAGFGATA